MKECIDGIYAVDGCIPCLCTLRLQQPALHFLDGLEVVGRNLLQGLDSHRLRGYLIVEP